MKDILINGKTVGFLSKPFIIAEMSGNHNHSLERALKIVEEAAKAGADAIKIQTYTSETMTLNLKTKDFMIEDAKSLWHGKSLYDLYGEAYTPWEWHKPIFEKCHDLGIIGFSTPFDPTAIEFLETLNVPCYKIASFENTDIPLIKKVAALRKPLIISTGMASEKELDETVKAVKKAGGKDLILLKCTSSYPAQPKDMNLKTIPYMREKYKCQIGLSDHTLNNVSAIGSIFLGATVIEKHFTLSRAEGGVDSAFSLEPQELKSLVEETKMAWEAIGKINLEPTESEKGSLKFRRSLYIAQDIKKGDFFNAQNVRSIRPGYGLPPKEIEKILGKRAKKDLIRGTALSWDVIQ